jgi:hypothetical protein
VSSYRAEASRIDLPRAAAKDTGRAITDHPRDTITRIPAVAVVPAVLCPLPHVAVALYSPQGFDG